MGESEDGGNMMQRLQSSSSFTLNNQMEQLSIPQFNTSQMRRHHFQQEANINKRAGMPPSHPHQIPPISPYSQIPISRSQITSHNTSPTPTHTRSLSQPSFFSLESLPPLSPCPFRDASDPADVSMEDRDTSHNLLPPSSPFTRNPSRAGENVPLPPRKAHRRSNSDIPFGFSTVLQSSPPLIPLRGREVAKPARPVKKETTGWENHNVEGSGEKKSPEGEVVDDLFSAYMNLDTIDALNSSGTDDKNGVENRDDLDSRASGTKTNGGDSSDNEAESSVNESGDSMQRQQGMNNKRSAGNDIAPTTRHSRSVSMDSFIGKLNFNDESLKLPPSPGLISPSNGIDGNSAAFSLEFGSGEFSGPELKKIMANEKLAEIAMADPKRAKRCCPCTFVILYRS